MKMFGLGSQEGAVVTDGSAILGCFAWTGQMHRVVNARSTPSPRTPAQRSPMTSLWDYPTARA